MKDLMVQCRFERRDAHTLSVRQGWVEAEAWIQEGTAVEIDDVPGIWVVTSISRPMHRLSIKRGWRNNI